MIFTNKIIKNSCLVLFIFIVNLLLYGIFLRFDISLAHPWRQTDSQAEITAYARHTTDFVHPTVNAPVTQWGPGVIEIPLPIFQYTSAKLVNLLRPYLASFTEYNYAGPIKLPIGLKATTYSETKKIEPNKIIYTLNFTVKPTLGYRLLLLAYPSLADFFHLLVVYDRPAKNKSCVSITNRRANLIGSVSDEEQQSDYCFDQRNIPILYLPIAVGKNQLEFSFPKQMAPNELSSDFKIFSETSYAIPELMAARLLNIFILSLTAIILACTFFPPGYFRLATIVAISVLPAFGFFAYFIHEEMLAFLCVSIFLWIIFKQQLKFKWLIFAGFSLGLATALRPYYGLYGILLAVLAFHKEGVKAFLRPGYYFAALLTILPALVWYSWTQYLVSHGADTIDIFNNRIVWSSLLKWDLWKAYGNFFISAHLTRPVTLMFLVLFLITAYQLKQKKIKFFLQEKVFLGCGLLIAVVVLPLVFDSATIHNYYQFPVSSYVILAAFICFYKVYHSISDKRVSLLSFALFFGVIFASGVFKIIHVFVLEARDIQHPNDYSVLGNLTGKFFGLEDKVVLLDAGGPQVYGLTNRNGRRDAGYYCAYPFRNAQEIGTYLKKWYGPVSTYKGIGICDTAMHNPENFNNYKNYVRTQLKSGSYIEYSLSSYLHCEITKFVKN